jgi:SSS family solute:Na+ symporter
MMRLLPPGLLGLVFSALVAAIIASTASKINSIATIFTLDVYAKRRRERTRAEDDSAESLGEEKHLVLVGRITAIVAILIAIIAARPLVGSSEQAFQYIQEFTGFFTPGITVIFLLGLFWKRANEAGAIVAAVTSVGLSAIMKYTLPAAIFSQGINDYLTPFINRMGVVFLVSLALAVIVSLATPQRAGADTIDTTGVRYKTSAGFNIGALGVVLVLIALYATWW